MIIEKIAKNKKDKPENKKTPASEGSYKIN